MTASKCENGLELRYPTGNSDQPRTLDREAPKTKHSDLHERLHAARTHQRVEGRRLGVPGLRVIAPWLRCMTESVDAKAPMLDPNWRRLAAEWATT